MKLKIFFYPSPLGVSGQVVFTLRVEFFSIFLVQTNSFSTKIEGDSTHKVSCLRRPFSFFQGKLPLSGFWSRFLFVQKTAPDICLNTNSVFISEACFRLQISLHDPFRFLLVAFIAASERKSSHLLVQGKPILLQGTDFKTTATDNNVLRNYLRLSKTIFLILKSTWRLM